MKHPPADDAAALWDYAVALYAAPGVKHAALALQDEHGLDVNVVLFIAWHAERGGASLSADELARLSAAVRPWADAVTRPLRAVRRHLSGDHGLPEAGAVPALHERVLAAEIDSERVALSLLAAAAPAVGERLDAGQRALASFHAYARLCGADARAAGRHFAVIDGARG